MIVFVLVSILTVPVSLIAQGAHLKFDLGDLPSQAKTVVDISIDKNTMDWAQQALDSKGVDADKVQDLMKELEGVTIKVVEFEKGKTPGWEKLLSAARGVLKELDGPQWHSVISVTDKEAESPTIVRISIFKAPNDKTGGAALLVVEPENLVFLNLVGKVKLDQLNTLGKILGQPGILSGQTGKSSSKSK